MVKRFISLFLVATFLISNVLASEHSESLDISQDISRRITTPIDYEREFVPGEVLIGFREPLASRSTPLDLFPELNIIEAEDNYKIVVDSILDSLLESSLAVESSVASRRDAHRMDAVELKELEETVHRNIDTSRYGKSYLLKLAEGDEESVIDAIEVLLINPNVEYAHPNYISYPMAIPAQIPNDYSNYNLWGLDKIQAPQAWNITTGSKAVRVGVLDTGVDHTHPDLAGNI
jgi:hypothetical protein